MYSRKTGLIFGFHGCDQAIIEKIVLGLENLKHSENSYDWLGHGIYFWENSQSRAQEFAEFLSKHPDRSHHPIKTPAVIGAVLDLGFCLDLTDFANLVLLKESYELFIAAGKKSQAIPTNKVIGSNKDLLLRDLDCAIIETLHTARKEKKLPAFDSVRGVFWEGEDLYPNAGFKEKNHIQICIRNPNCIKGFFIPREFNNAFSKV